MNKVLIICIVSYLIGNFSSAFILGKVFKNKDVRNYGSGNAGATNALRVFGLKLGLASFVLDILKGIIAVNIGNYFLGYDGALIAGIFVVIGHNWPLLLKFKGGKGIATSLGVMLYLHLPTALVCIAIGFFVIYKTRYVSLGSITATVLVPFLGCVLKRPFDKNFLICTIVLASMAIFRHRSNIVRLLRGEESKLGQRVN
ncbi:glycerol-3-phosphate 1-O-acyltransferase PlsY [Anaerosalibacter sp. Marseille-P3206]|uniref:glycerol-3-phosphate 1-O-acyltransferase PlsY n=1 Tax=Anaerosalibacter sp. Marseille-P3206 TaxID=1871005 RepID=UPI001F1F957B|nr:glycerol-3-phosphate 1-O-acyltransferase PlsY [Anaerosalibacter sp. Marseille-P3206]